MSNIVTNLSELQLYVNILEESKGIKYNNYETLIKDLLLEFGLTVDRQQLNELFEPSIEESVEDIKIMLGNVC